MQWSGPDRPNTAISAGLDAINWEIPAAALKQGRAASEKA